MRVDGRGLRDQLLDRLAREIADSGEPPGCLATLVASDDELSHRQAGLKHRACERVGMGWRAVALDGSATTEAVLSAVDELAADPTVHGIFVHLPMPAQVDTPRVVAEVPADKDVDGMTAVSPFEPASARAAVEVLRAYDVPLGHSRVALVGGTSPLAAGLWRLLTPMAVEVSRVDPDEPAAAASSARADVVISAAFKPQLVTAAWVRRGAVVVDAASGDLDVESVANRAGLLCASPGGIGPVTVACLLEATRVAVRQPARSSSARDARTA